MAAVEVQPNFSSPINCKKCGKSLVKNYVKCKKCPNSFHPSCAKYTKGVKIIGDGIIECCGTESSEAISEAFFDAMESVSMDNKVDLSLFSYIIKQKDALICELQDKIKVLNENIVLLRRVNLLDRCEGQCNKDSGKKDITKSEESENCKKYVDKVPITNSTSRLNLNEQKININMTRIQANKNSKQESAELLTAATKQKLNEIINLKNDLTTCQSSTAPTAKDAPQKIEESEWKVITHKRATQYKNRIVGSNKETLIKGVPRLVHLHVCRINTDYKLQLRISSNCYKDHFQRFSVSQ